MKKMYLFLLMAFLALGSGHLFAQQKVLEDGFETTDEGKIPDGWTLSDPSALKTWKVEKDKGNNLFDPAACASGKGRIKFAGNGNGAGSEVMLISPVMDITALAEPILVFDYAAVRTSTGAVDSLKVYFRMRSDRDWVMVKSLGEADNWTRDTVEFPSKTKSFQIAFGAVDRDGRGVALDNVSFSSRPVSEEVSNVEVYNKIHNEAKLRWSGSLNAIYHVKISTQELRNPAIATEAEGLYISQDVEYTTNMQINASTNNELTPSTTYYYYIQTDLGYGDVSGWVSGQFTSACEPVQSFSTSFDAPEDLACWTTIGESHGAFIATRPNNVPDSVCSGFDNSGLPIFMTTESTRPSPYSGASALWMPVKSLNDNDYSRVYAVSPRLADNVNLKDMQLTFWMKTNSKQIHLRLIVSEWPDDFSNAQESGEIVARSTNIYERFSLTFEDINSNGKYIAFMIDGSEEMLKMPQFPAIHIDDIVLEEKAACSKETKVIMFAEPDLQGTSATLKWNRSGASQFIVKVSNASMNPANDPGTVFEDTVSSPEALLKNLSPATRYFYYVRPICADGVLGTWSNAQYFDTECLFDGVELPLRENFDKFEIVRGAITPLPVCWTIKIPSGAEGYGPYINNGDNAHSDYNFIYYYGLGSTFVSTPKINADLKDCQVRFAFTVSNAYMPIEVGIMSDPTDNSTFVKMAEFTVNGETNTEKVNTWVEKTVRFEDYTGNGKYVAFHFPTAHIDYRIDDVVVEDASSCAEPKDVRMTGATTSSVTLDWAPSDNNETEWEVAYAKQGANFSTAEIVTGVKEHPYTLTGLAENTAYDIYLRSVCDADAKGIWVGPFKVKTISPATLPYVCNFENLAASGAWTLLNGTQDNQWIIGDAVKNEQCNGSAVGRTLYITSDYGTTNFAQNKETYAYATRLFDLEAGLIDFEFDWRMPGAKEFTGETDYNGNPKFGTNGAIVPFLVPENIVITGGVADKLFQLRGMIGKSSWRGIDWTMCIPNGWILLNEGVGVLAHHTSDWQHYKYSYPLRQSGRYNLVIVYMTPTKVDASIMAASVDNVSVKANTTDCIAAVDLVVRDITQSSAKVNFLNYNTTEWKVVLADSVIDTAVDNLETITTAHKHVIYADNQTNNPLQLTDLQPETEYWVYMRPACGSADTWQSISFSTICSAHAVPVAYTFDEPEFNEMGEIDGNYGPEYGRLKSFMDCWRRIPDKSPGTYIQGGCSGIYQFQFEDIKASNATNMFIISTNSSATSDGYNGPAYVASPELVSNVKDLMLVFRAVSQYDYADRAIDLEIGIMTDPLDTSTFELIETVSPTYKGKWRKYFIYFDSYAGTGKHIALRLPQIPSFTPTIFIDDLKIDSIRGCVPTRSISVDNITENSAEISWGGVGTSGSYHVKVTTEPLGRWEDRANVYDDTVVGNTSVLVDKLSASKLYYAYVRTVCTEEGGFSEGMSETQFRTACGSTAVLPYFEDFETYEVNSLPDCWYVMENDPQGGSHLAEFNITTNLGENYKQLGRLSLIFQTGSQELFPTMLALPAVTEDIKELSLSFKALQNSSDQLIVGVVSDVNDPSTFVAVDSISCAAKYVWEDVTVNFSHYTGKGKHFAFRVPSAWYSASFIIDEVMIRKSAVTCADAVVPQVLNIDATSATVRWADNPVAEAFELKIASTEINPEIEDGDVMQATKFTDLQTTVDKLAPATTYFVYMRNICSGNEGGYWSKATVFTTACADPEQIPYFEDFTGYGDIADFGFFPVCWRRNVEMFGSISPDVQPEPYIENAVRPSLFMKTVYDGSDGAYSVVDVATPKLVFGDANAAGYVMRLAFRSNKKQMPIYVGLMSDPTDPSTFVVYDTLRNNYENTWENQEVNFFYHQGTEQHIAFRISSLDAVPEGYNPDSVPVGETYEGYQVNLTDIEVLPKSDCMPPYRVRADIRPNRAFVSWIPGNDAGKEWIYYFADGSKMDSIPFTEQEFKDANGYAERMVIDTTTETSLVLNNLEDWTDYYLYIRNKECDDAFWRQCIDMSGREVCQVIASMADLPVAPDFRNNGLGIGLEPQFSSYFDCWYRLDDFEGDTVAYPYITDDAELLFHTVADSACTAIVRKTKKDAFGIMKETQLRFSARALAEGAQMVIGVTGNYTKGWPSVNYFDFMPYDTIALTTTTQEYVVKYDDLVWQAPDPSANYAFFAPAITIVKNNADFVVSELSWEEIPYCFTPELDIISRGTTEFKVEWQKLDGQDEWKVAYGEHGFDIEKAKLVPRTDTNYTVVNLKEGTPYEFYVQSLCLNGMTSEWGRICVTTDQMPAAYPYKSADFADATVIDADDTLYFAYRTVTLPAGPHTLSFDWKTADAQGAYLRVFTVPADEMITADNEFGIDETSVPQGWSHVATLKGKSAWTAASHTMYIKTAEAGAVNVVFVWTQSGNKVKEVVRNVNISSSDECTVPEELYASQITSTSAALNWTSFNATAWDINYWETADKANTSESLMDFNPGDKLTGLNPDTEYSFEVSSVCKPGIYSEPYTFRTACATIDTLVETFDRGVIGGCWALYKGKFDEVVAGQSNLIPTYEGWDVTNVPVLGSSQTPNARLTIAGDDCNYWLVTPSVSLAKNSALSFDLAFTAYNDKQNVNPNGQTDDRFIVVVSTDEGQTWNAADATIWNNEDDLNYSLNRIGNHSRRIEVDLSAYTGKTVRIAFYGESSIEVETNDIHIDSVRIDERILKQVTGETCQGYSYYAQGFSIDREDLKAHGVYKFVRVERANSKSKLDTTYVLSLNVKESKVHEYNAQICSDKKYSDQNFLNLTETGTYTKVMVASNGCDSTIILNLTVDEAYRLERSITINASELPYTFACHEFPVGTVSGKHEINCKTQAGCDSIIVLDLTVEGTVGVNNVVKNETLILTPNPVEGGRLITVNYDFDQADLNGLTIKVFNSLGQLVSVSTPEGLPLAFNAPYASGVYNVHIVLSDNRVLLGRFIVK